VSNTSLFEVISDGPLAKTILKKLRGLGMIYGGCPSIKVHTCVPLYLVRCRQFSEPVVVGCFCSWCIAVVALVHRVSEIAGFRS